MFQIVQPRDISLTPGIADLAITLFYLILIFSLAYFRQSKKSIDNPAYAFYTWGILAKMSGAIALCFVYIYYYGGTGDIFGYYYSAVSLSNMALRDFGVFLKIMAGYSSPELWSHFDSQTGYPWHRHDYAYVTTFRLMTPFVILGFRSFFVANILIAWFAFKGIWKLYLLFCELYPGRHRQFAIAILFFPSLLFWGSGMLKDTFTLSATAWLTCNLYYLFIKKQDRVINIIWLIINTYIIILVKPYIFVALAPGTLIWLSFNNLKKIENPVLRFASAPALVTIFVGISLLLLSTFRGQLGEYGSLENIIEKAVITQDDMMRAEAYSENYFDIGRLDGTVINFFSKIPAATNATLFRPYLWEVRNPLMLISAVENTLFMLMVFLIFWRTGLVKGVKIIMDEPLVIFSILFTIMFAFAVGVANANFGALVRLRIPFIPFFTGSLVVMQYLSIKWKLEKRISEQEQLKPGINFQKALNKSFEQS